MYIPQKPTWSSVELALWQYSRSEKDMDSLSFILPATSIPRNGNNSAMQGGISYRLWNFCCAFTWPASSSLSKLCSSLGVSICVYLGDFYHRGTHLSPFLSKRCSKVGEMKSTPSPPLQRNLQPWLCVVGWRWENS